MHVLFIILEICCHGMDNSTAVPVYNDFRCNEKGAQPIGCYSVHRHRKNGLVAWNCLVYCCVRVWTRRHYKSNPKRKMSIAIQSNDIHCILDKSIVHYVCGDDVGSTNSSWLLVTGKWNACFAIAYGSITSKSIQFTLAKYAYCLFSL